MAPYKEQFMLNNKTISLIIPCKNEQDSIGRLLRRVPKYIDEVIVVDNNSSDNTAQVAQKFGAKVITEKRHDRFGIGYGYAHQKGMKAASSDFIVTMDGDGTYPLSDIRKIIEKMDQTGLDFVSCNRFPLKNPDVISPMRQFGAMLLNLETSLLYQYPMKDILSGMWVIRKSVVHKLKPKSGGWDLSPEIKLNALMHPEIMFAEYHINHHYRDNGASKQQLWQTGFNHLKYITIKRLTEDNPALKLGRQAIKFTKAFLKQARIELSLE